MIASLARTARSTFSGSRCIHFDAARRDDHDRGDRRIQRPEIGGRPEDSGKRVCGAVRLRKETLDRTLCRCRIAGEALHARYGATTRVHRDVACGTIDESLNGVPEELKVAACEVAGVND